MTKSEKLNIAQEAARIIIRINKELDQLEQLKKNCWEIKKKTMAQIKELGIEYETIQEIISQEKKHEKKD